MSDTSPLAETLEDRLRARIRSEGPITFHEWMEAALYDEHEGYYSTGKVRQGRAGDYRTAPETSPLFAATLARYFSKLHTALKCPHAWMLFEAGAGNGELAHGILTQLRTHYPEIFAATRYALDEINPAARAQAVKRLSDFSDQVTFQRLSEIAPPLDPGIIFSNELIDAFPVHRLRASGGKLRELCVGLHEDGFNWVECDVDFRVEDYVRQTGIEPAEGQIVEVNLRADEFISRAANSLARGYLITIDYGAHRKDLWREPQRRMGTLRAFRRHQLVEDVLAKPGQQDLTTTIDWTQVEEAGKRAGLKAIRFQRLDEFLMSEGLLDLISDLTNSTPDPVAFIRLSTSARELVLPTGLAASFQVLVQEKVF
jgi:SAM-dependent MidA family methyltransferase